MMTAMYAAVKWPVGADAEEIKRLVTSDLEILALTLAEEHGLSYDEIEEMFQYAVASVEWHL